MKRLLVLSIILFLVVLHAVKAEEQAGDELLREENDLSLKFICT